MQIEPIALLSDNYAWIWRDDEATACAVVDPSEGPPMEAALRARGLQVACVLATHHHPDHVDGIPSLARPGVQVVASEYDRKRVPCVTRTVTDDDTLEVLGHTVHCMMVPGHTLGAVAFYVPHARAVFTGDTLFLGGCGRLFEGNPAQMHGSLQRLAALPGDTQVYCGHEYTEKNLRFALSLEPDSTPVKKRLEEVMARRRHGEPSVPAPLSVEKQTNPFLRANSPAMQARVGEAGGVATLAKLRAMRDDY